VFLESSDLYRAECETRESELQTQAELAHANRVATMGYLAASIVHELKQPIAAMIMNARAASRWLDRPTPNLDEARKAIDCILRDGARADILSDRTRDLARKGPRRKDLVELDAVICDALDLVRPEAAKNGVSVQTEFVETLPPVLGDRVELQQVVLNLMINAIEAMTAIGEGGRELLIRAESAEGGSVRISVCDSGPGLAPGIEETLFEAFNTTKSNGLGLGLSICRSIIEGHGGRLSATANAPRGAIFEFTVPPCLMTAGATN
jgi:C4-dicarboxylate-specific signal transduction histidine kinase